MEEKSQQSVPVVGSIDLIAMAEIHFLPIQVKDGRSAQYPGIEGLLEKGAHVKIMVPFEVYDPDPFFMQQPELFEHRQIVDERDLRVPDPELEQIAQDKKSIGFFRQSGKEIDKKQVIPIVFAFQMGI